MHIGNSSYVVPRAADDGGCSYISACDKYLALYTRGFFSDGACWWLVGIAASVRDSSRPSQVGHRSHTQVICCSWRGKYVKISVFFTDKKMSIRRTAAAAAAVREEKKRSENYLRTVFLLWVENDKQERCCESHVIKHTLKTTAWSRKTQQQQQQQQVSWHAAKPANRAIDCPGKQTV